MGPNFKMTASNTQPGVLVYTKCHVEGKPGVLEHQILSGRDYHTSFGGWINIQLIYGKSSCSPMYPYTRIQVHIRLLVYVYICIYKKYSHKHAHRITYIYITYIINYFNICISPLQPWIFKAAACWLHLECHGRWMAPTAPDLWTKVATSARTTEHMGVQQVVVVDDLSIRHGD